jgi:hypothetical protein
VIPELITTVIVLGFSMGFLLGEGGSKFDEEIKYGAGKTWYNALPLYGQAIVNYILNVTHHFQYGLVAIIIGHIYLTGMQQQFAWYFGWGMIISDWKDYKNILKRLGFVVTEEPTTPPMIPSIVTSPPS